MTGESGVLLLLGSAPEHGLSAKAVEIGRVFNFPVTNSMAVTWVVALGLIIFVRTAARRMDQVPNGAPKFLEWLAESLYGFSSSYFLLTGWDFCPESEPSHGGMRPSTVSRWMSHCFEARTPM